MENVTILPGKWEKGAAMPTGRNHLGCAAVGDLIYCMGGLASSGTTSCMEIYNTKTNQWMVGKSMPGGMSDILCFVANGKIYCVLPNNNTNPIYVYDVAQNTWTSQVNTRLIARPCAVVGNKINFHNSNAKLNTVDLETNELQTYSSEACKHSTSRAYAETNGKIYSVGMSADKRNIQIYDLETRTVTTGKAMDDVVRFALAAIINKKFYVLGGEYGSTTYCRNDLAIYDFETDIWINGPQMHTRRYNFACAAVNGKIYCFGGKNIDSDALDTVEIYTPGEVDADTCTVTHRYQTADGAQIAPNSPYTVRRGDAYTAYAATIPGYTCVGCRLDDGALQTGLSLTLDNVTEDHTAVFVYEQGDPVEEELRTITTAYRTQGGVQLLENTEAKVQVGTRYSTKAPVISGYTCTGHRIDGGALEPGGTAVIEDVQADHDIVFIYLQNTTDPDSNPNPGEHGHCCCTGCGCCAPGVSVKLEARGYQPGEGDAITEALKATIQALQ